jgi:hypothetical protein
VLIDDLSILLAHAHPASYELVEKIMLQVDNTLFTGFNRLNWLSVNVDEFFLIAEEKIRFMSNFLEQISSFIVDRIEQPIIELTRFDILEFPDEPIDINEFVDHIRRQILFKAERLNSASMQIESAVRHVIRMFFDKAGYQSKPFELRLADIGRLTVENNNNAIIRVHRSFQISCNYRTYND